MKFRRASGSNILIFRLVRVKDARHFLMIDQQEEVVRAFNVQSTSASRRFVKGTEFRLIIVR